MTRTETSCSAGTPIVKRVELVNGFGAALMRRLPYLRDTDPYSLARLLGRELRELGEPVALFLDNYHRLAPGCPVDAILSQTLRDQDPFLHLVVATRGARPGVATRLLAEGRAIELGPEDLSLRAGQVEGILRDRGVSLDSAHLPNLLARTGVVHRRLTIVPESKIQWVGLTASPPQRRLGIATVTVSTAAGAAHVPDLDRVEALALQRDLSGAASTAGAWLPDAV